MAVRGNHGVGIPAVMFREGEGLVVTIESKTGHTYRGTVVSTEDNMNISMKGVTCTDPEGNKTSMERVFIRGSQVLYAIYPDILHHAPFFARVAKAAQGLTVAGGLGRQRQQAITAKAAKRKAEEVRNVAVAAREAMRPAMPHFMPPPSGFPRPGMDSRPPPMSMPPPHMGGHPGGMPPSMPPQMPPQPGMGAPAGGRGVGRGVEATRPAWAR